MAAASSKGNPLLALAQGSPSLSPHEDTAAAPMDARVAECGICYEAYKEAAGGRVPKLLWCHHSLCLACLRKLVCPNGALSFVVCPFCRMVTMVPQEGLQALRDDKALLQEAAPQGPAGLKPEERLAGDKGTPGNPDWALGDSAVSLDVELNCRPGSPTLAVSSLVPVYSTGVCSSMRIWGGFRLQEVPNTVLVELPSRTASRDSPTPQSVENLRLCFAVTVILLIISVFFSLVFFK